MRTKLGHNPWRPNQCVTNYGIESGTVYWAMTPIIKVKQEDWRNAGIIANNIILELMEPPK